MWYNKIYSLFLTVLATLSVGKNSDLYLNLKDLHIAVLYFEPFPHAYSRSLKSLLSPNTFLIITNK